MCLTYVACGLCLRLVAHSWAQQCWVTSPLTSSAPPSGKSLAVVVWGVEARWRAAVFVALWCDITTYAWCGI